MDLDPNYFGFIEDLLFDPVPEPEPEPEPEPQPEPEPEIELQVNARDQIR